MLKNEVNSYIITVNEHLKARSILTNARKNDLELSKKIGQLFEEKGLSFEKANHTIDGQLYYAIKNDTKMALFRQNHDKSISVLKYYI